MKNLFITGAALFVLNVATSFAQDTIPALTIDSTLNVGDNVNVGNKMTIGGETRMLEDARAERDLTVDGVATFNGQIFYPNAPTFAGDMQDREIVVFNHSTGRFEKST